MSEEKTIWELIKNGEAYPCPYCWILIMDGGDHFKRCSYQKPKPYNPFKGEYKE